MNTIARTGAPYGGSLPVNGASTPPPAARACDLLPAPEVDCLSLDPTSLLFLCESQSQTLDVEQGTRRLQGLEAERSDALAQEQHAIQAQVEASRKHDFWSDLGSAFGDIAKVAGIVGALAVTVCTLGAATPLAALAIAGVVLSAASFVDGEFHVLQRLGVDPNAAAWIDTGLALGGSACSLGAGFVSGGPAAARAAGLLGRVASVTGGVATMAHGATTIELGQTQAATDRAAADEVLASAQISHALRFMQLVVDETQSSDTESRSILSTLGAIKGVENETAETSAGAVSGVRP